MQEQLGLKAPQTSGPALTHPTFDPAIHRQEGKAHPWPCLRSWESELLQQLASAVGDCVLPHAQRLQESAAIFLYGYPACMPGANTGRPESCR